MRSSVSFRSDGIGSRAGIGLIYIASSIVMGAEMAAVAAAGVSVWHGFDLLDNRQ